MPSDTPPHGGRRPFHRGRRGYDRRGGDRRGTPPPQQPFQPGEQPPRDHVDVEQIMRDIRAKIAQRHGVDLTDQQVQELAARRLESILDPRTMKPSLLDQLRRSAGARPGSVAAADRASAPYEFEDTTLYDSSNGLIRFLRKLLNPILKLFFNPNPLVQALHIQARLNAEAARREAERDERQAEWNALHYEILQRVVAELAKLTLEAQDLALRSESLAAKVDFNERRVRGIEGVVHQPRSAGRDRDRDTPAPAPPPAPRSEPAAAQPAPPAPEAPAGEAPRRRRRRRRGRRSGSGELTPAAAAQAPTAPEAVEGDEEDDVDEIEEASAGAIFGSAEVVTTGTDAIDQIDEPAGADRVPTEAPPSPPPEPVTREPAIRNEDEAPVAPVPSPPAESETDEPR